MKLLTSGREFLRAEGLAAIEYQLDDMGGGVYDGRLKIRNGDQVVEVFFGLGGDGAGRDDDLAALHKIEMACLHMRAEIGKLPEIEEEPEDGEEEAGDCAGEPS